MRTGGALATALVRHLEVRLLDRAWVATYRLIAMTTRQRLEDDEYRDEVEQRLGEIEDKPTSELYELKQSDDPVDSDAAKLEMNHRYGQSAGDSKIRGKVKRGTDTRDQDELVLEGRGEDADEAADDFEQALERAEEGDWASRLRNLQDE